ncbi:unnamed protein product [Rangifer tarandus platyrhynchus]|uniref:Uncharacterized protein n=1 Tax=Rangifer tarandus platyrhynchus TaxID=3082113 RepID=A0AC59YMX6_RANTA
MWRQNRPFWIPGGMGSVHGPCQQTLRATHRPSVHCPLCPVRMAPSIPAPISSWEKKGRKLETERRNESKTMEGRRGRAAAGRCSPLDMAGSFQRKPLGWLGCGHSSFLSPEYRGQNP